LYRSGCVQIKRNQVDEGKAGGEGVERGRKRVKGISRRLE
jgi:hypothetical protein